MWFALPGADWPMAVVALGLGTSLMVRAFCGPWGAMELGARAAFVALLMLAAGMAHMAFETPFCTLARPAVKGRSEVFMIVTA